MITNKEFINNCNENEFCEFLSNAEHSIKLPEYSSDQDMSFERIMFDVAVIIVRLNKINMMKILLHDYNFDISHDDNWIIEYCGECGSVDMMILLLEHNNINMTDSNEILCQVMENACEGNNYPIIKMLLEYGFDLNILDYNQFTQIISENNLDIVKLFIEYGINVKYQNNRALYIAIKNKHYDMVILLLQNGADTNDVNLRFSNQQDNETTKFINLLIENNIDIVAWLNILLSGKKLKFECY